MSSVKQPLLGSAAGTGLATDAIGITMPAAAGSGGVYRPLASAPAGGMSAGSQPVAAEFGGLHAAPAPIDEGFDSHTEFPRGMVDFRRGTDDLDLTALQQPLSCCTKFCGFIGATLTGATGIGLVYLLSKLTLVRRGEIATVEWLNGNIRVLGPGWHLIETFGTSVTKHALTNDRIAQGSLHLIRILPGHVGLALQNGKPVLLLEGRHLINDPLFSFQQQISMTQAHI